jgi:hypothetical protein
MHGVPQCAQALRGNAGTTHKTESMLILEGRQLNAELEDSGDGHRGDSRLTKRELAGKFSRCGVAQ